VKFKTAFGRFSICSATSVVKLGTGRRRIACCMKQGGRDAGKDRA
jgi:hypothetical protein